MELVENSISQKLKEISKILSKIIKTFYKVMEILKILGVWLKNWGRGSHVYFELKMAATRSILKLQKNYSNMFLPKHYFS